MRKFRHFFNKLAYALVALVALSSVFEPLIGNTSSTQVTYAKKAKKAKGKRHKKVRKVTSYKNWRWKEAKAKVYIDLDNNQNLISATNDAIEAWNATGAFTFTKTKRKKKADIVIEQVYSPNSNYAGYTTFNYYVKTKILYSALVKLNTYYLENFSPYDYTYDRVVNTVEHELGHAIGLKHNKGESVMYPTGSLYSIMPIDITNINRLYK